MRMRLLNELVDRCPDDSEDTTFVFLKYVAYLNLCSILLNLPYYYGRAGEQYAFFRIPKLLLTDERFAEVSTDAKLLYGLLLDRMELSYRNGWIDEQNRVFIIFTAEEVMSTLHCRSEKAARLFAELDSSKGIGLIERKRQGLGRPTLIYVKDFSGA